MTSYLKSKLSKIQELLHFVTLQDFGDVIPGHGGIMDRFDCQYLMATFVNVYITSFIRTASPQKLLQQVKYLNKRKIRITSYTFFLNIKPKFYITH